MQLTRNQSTNQNNEWQPFLHVYKPKTFAILRQAYQYSYSLITEKLPSYPEKGNKNIPVNVVIIVTKLNVLCTPANTDGITCLKQPL